MPIKQKSWLEKLRAVFASFAFRFMLRYVVGLSAAVLLVMVSLYATYSYQYFVDHERIIDDQLHDLSLRIERGENLEQVSLLPPPPVRGENYFLLLDAGGNKIAGNLNAWPKNLYQNWWDLKSSTFFTGEELPALTWMFGKSETLADGRKLLVVRDYGDILMIERYISHVAVRSALLTILLGALGGICMATRSIRNVDHINQSIARIIAGNLSERIPAAELRGDFKVLAMHFNQLLDRVQGLMEGMRQVTDNIAHDLRTPLTRMRNQIADLMQAAPAPVCDQVPVLLNEADALLSTFNALLRIAQIESGQRRSGFRQTDLQVILADLIELYEPLAMEKRQSMVAQINEPLLVAGDRDLLFQAFANLIDNAIKYTPPEGSIRLSAHREPDGSARVELCDSGEGIPEEDRCKVFRRFYRVEASRSAQPGNGLGLSLVAAVVRLHHADIMLADGAPGLLVTVRLPPCGAG